MTSPYHFRINRSHIATVTAYLKDEVNGRKRYFKAKHIAKDIGLKTGQVAGVMRWMLVNPSEFKISKEGYSKSTTWGCEKT